MNSADTNPRLSRRTRRRSIERWNASAQMLRIRMAHIDQQWSRIQGFLPWTEIIGGAGHDGAAIAVAVAVR